MNIILIGFMGTGKTTIGKQLATSLSMPFIDLDEEITKQMHADIPSIFAQYGEKRFRDLEHQCLTESLTRQDTIISTGGGIVENDANIDLLTMTNAKIIWLTSSLNETLQRLLNDIKDRPLITNATLPEFWQLWQTRQPKYRAIADLILATDQKQPNKIVAEIKQHLQHPTPFDEQRSQIDAVDHLVLTQLVHRLAVVEEVGQIKRDHAIPVVQTSRMQAMRQQLKLDFDNQLPHELIDRYVSLITGIAIKQEQRL